ncbi:VPDSG-CTERM sorting domain-containing protein [Oleiharenicola lentus]|uniref:VPDSG-CTERM sorting domain-containing protein n=1 Tax=Oleiharenicola lentus TaxID=2508720 RepID=A0A4Q1C8I6_9BACT|nr:VPDSG-CTERM sorting domain-containing protein [Oleiharenicola lentus]RXK55161.1 VPDSG-CTERM sorting domain-containing protein [Oleiharenicola lentus]
MSLRTLRLILLAGLLFGGRLTASPITFQYNGDLLPNQGSYGSLFTTIGPGGPASYWPTTNWSSDGDVLTMSTAHGAGIWFGAGWVYGDNPGFSLANTADGNLVRTRVALGANSTEWSQYWYDSSGYGSAFYFLNNGFKYYTAAGETFVSTDMTQFHTFTTYVLAGQVSYFFDNTYLGGGGALTGASNFFLIGDGSGSTISGTGSMYLDDLTIITAVGADAPTIAAGPQTPGVPDTGATALLLAGGLLSLAGLRRRA